MSLYVLGRSKTALTNTIPNKFGNWIGQLHRPEVKERTFEAKK